MKDIKTLIEDLKDPDTEVCKAAITELVGIGKPAVPALIRATKKDKEWKVCWAAVWILGEIGDISALPGLTRALRDKDFYIRAWTATALGKINDDSVVPVLIGTLKDENEYVRGKAMDALERTISRCETIGQLDRLQDKVQETYDKLGGERKKEYCDVEIAVAQLMQLISLKRNTLARDKGILLDDIPKPPKGNKLYQQLRVMRNV